MGVMAGKTALITGGGNGLGRATALAVAREGGSVALVDLDKSGLDETIELVTAAGGSALGIAADVTDPDQSPTTSPAPPASSTASTPSSTTPGSWGPTCL